MCRLSQGSRSAIQQQPADPHNREPRNHSKPLRNHIRHDVLGKKHGQQPQHKNAYRMSERHHAAQQNCMLRRAALPHQISRHHGLAMPRFQSVQRSEPEGYGYANQPQAPTDLPALQRLRKKISAPHLAHRVRLGHGRGSRSSRRGRLCLSRKSRCLCGHRICRHRICGHTICRHTLHRFRSFRHHNRCRARCAFPLHRRRQILRW